MTNDVTNTNDGIELASLNFSESDSASRFRDQEYSGSDEQSQSKTELGRKNGGGDGSVATWAWTSAGVISILCLLLLFFPRFLLFLSSSTQSPHYHNHQDSDNVDVLDLTPLERLLATQLGLVLLTIVCTLVLNLPTDPSDLLQSSRAKAESQSQNHPLLGPFTATSLLASFIAYNTTDASTLSSVFCLAFGCVGVFGAWVILFQGTSCISKKTGADKHTSAFLFGNKTAASVRKKEWREEQKIREREKNT